MCATNDCNFLAHIKNNFGIELIEEHTTTMEILRLIVDQISRDDWVHSKNVHIINISKTNIDC